MYIYITNYICMEYIVSLDKLIHSAHNIQTEQVNYYSDRHPKSNQSVCE